MPIFLAIIISFLMGLVIQRGGTCTVAAIHELVHKGTTNRIRALIETALWVLAGALILSHLGFAFPLINNWQITSITIIGSVMLGIGAFVNGACAVGTIARIGNREWDFLAMIPGFFCGAAMIAWIHLPSLQPITLGNKTTPIIDSWTLIILVLLVLIRSISFYRKGFHPYVLTILIGIFFLGLVAIDKAWSYTDLLVDLATFNSQNYTLRVALFASLLLGAIVSGRYQDQKDMSLKKIAPNALKRFVGGAIMGGATLMLPGSHDSLILLYMPMLLGYAWIGFIVMASTILVAKLTQKKLKREHPPLSF